MTEADRRWLETHDANGALNKSVGFLLGASLGDLLRAGYVRNVGPDEPTMWDLVITQRGRDALASKQHSVDRTNDSTDSTGA